VRRAALIALAALAGALPALADPLDVALGKALFERSWIPAPASTESADGLGPLFNARSCAACHAGGGPARFTADAGQARAQGLVLRSAGPDGEPHPLFGAQIQTRSVPGLKAEAELTVSLADRLAVTARFPAEHRDDVLLEARSAPSLRGRGAIDRIDDAAILALADPQDRNGDGISGRPQLVASETGDVRPGRFGSKATGLDLLHQAASAAALDLGLSSPLLQKPHGDCTALQAECLARATGRSGRTDGEEMSSEMLRLIATYVDSLAAPDPDWSQTGFAVFIAAGCAACHVPRMPARGGGDVIIFSDLLLHDLGDGDAGSVRDGAALPGEWRSAPLRDLAPRAGTRRYLHGGAAATLEAAITLHGGEAAAARDKVQRLDGRERQLLLDFLSGL
jgi:CxxC motif-containing protein (DUF1111 family)